MGRSRPRRSTWTGWAKLRPGTRYGLGVIIRDTPLGPAWGHSGFFPGYATEMLYLPDHRMALALQINLSDPYPRGMVAALLAAVRGLEPRAGSR